MVTLSALAQSLGESAGVALGMVIALKIEVHRVSNAMCITDADAKRVVKVYSERKLPDRPLRGRRKAVGAAS